MTRRLLLYEDRHWRDLRPLTDLLPVPALAFGASDLARRWMGAVDAPLLAIEARHRAMAAWSGVGGAAGVVDAGMPFPERAGSHDDEVLCVNAAVLPGAWLDAALAARAPALFAADDRPVAARVAFHAIAPTIDRGEEFETALLGLGLPVFPVEAMVLRRPWDLVARNEQALRRDLHEQPPERPGRVHPQAVLLEPDRIAIRAGARIDALAVLDAREGPIRIDEGAVVLPHTVVTGPCRIGPGTQLLGGFVGNSSIGPECRIAGEVDTCVWQGWANKRHHGFVGHSVVGEWVNLGALTTTSDLKNNYGEVRVRVDDGLELATGANKFGAILGPHVKTGIGTLLPTGAWIGTGANLFGGGRFTPKHVPRFAWWDGERFAEHELERFLATARIAMGRRGQALLPPGEQELRALHAASARERSAAATR